MPHSPGPLADPHKSTVLRSALRRHRVKTSLDANDPPQRAAFTGETDMSPEKTAAKIKNGEATRRRGTQPPPSSDG